MRVDIKLMLGVVGLGAVAVYFMSQKPKAPEVVPSGPGPTPPLPGVMPTTRLQMLGDPLQLRQGRYYRMRANLPVLGMPPMISLSSEETLGRAIVGLGFDDVRVYMQAQNLPVDWPRETTQAPGSGTRWFSGRWGKPDLAVPRPSPIEMAWETPAPTS